MSLSNATPAATKLDKYVRSLQARGLAWGWTFSPNDGEVFILVPLDHNPASYMQTFAGFDVQLMPLSAPQEQSALHYIAPQH